MPNPTAKDVYETARKLLPELNEPIKKSVETLLARADAGEKVDNEIIEILAEDFVIRKKMREALYSESDFLSTRGYTGLAGNPSSPAAEKFGCPTKGCGYAIYIQKAGEEAGTCPKHGTLLVPIPKKRGK